MWNVDPFGTGFGQGLGLYAQPQALPNIPPPQEGLMSNTSAFQFLDALMNQPGGYNMANIPGYGTSSPFGMPMYLPPVQFGRELIPPPPTNSGGYGGDTGKPPIIVAPGSNQGK